jgi:enoyl-CoA hydratase/carnithine racemase
VCHAHQRVPVAALNNRAVNDTSRLLRVAQVDAIELALGDTKIDAVVLCGGERQFSAGVDVGSVWYAPRIASANRARRHGNNRGRERTEWSAQSPGSVLEAVSNLHVRAARASLKYILVAYRNGSAR